ncbi:hypothetical protein GJ496_001107 [Pomphorhynchus laevis]|nr:hypothetical protein GJ496_001107 [Pomphorhynchus laevis]
MNDLDSNKTMTVNLTLAKCRNCLDKLNEPLRTSIINNDFIIQDLAKCLCDEVTVSIITELLRIQKLTEHKLHKQRLDFLKNSEDSLNALLLKHDNEQQRIFETEIGASSEIEKGSKIANRLLSTNKHRQRSELNVLKSSLVEKLEFFDKKIVLEFEKMKMDQQQTLEYIGFPGFKVTDDKEEILLQMAIFFIVNEIIT